MRTIQGIRKRFWLAAALLTAMSATFLFMPLASAISAQTGGWSVRVLGAVFWLLAIAGYGTVIRANASRKHYLQKRFGRDIQKKLRPGAFCFFSNKLAEIADIMLILFAIAFAAASATWLSRTYYIFVILSLFIWAANMHCLFNGRIYRITKFEPKERMSDEK